jgi:hypothetical protein
MQVNIKCRKGLNHPINKYPELGAQMPVARIDQLDQQQMLKSQDSELQRNKTLVYDFVREVLEARHVELTPKFVTKDYIQHNPVVPTGRKGFMKFFAASEIARI